MQLFEKLRERRKSLGTQEEIHQKLVAKFGGNAISLSTLRRIENGVISKLDSIKQLASILGLDLRDLFKGTEFEKITVIRKKDQVIHLSINGFYARVVSGFTSSFLTFKCSLEPGKSRKPPSPADQTYEKWVTVLGGELICRVGNEDFLLKYGESMYFKSFQDHLFRNEGEIDCDFLIFHNPRYYST